MADVATIRAALSSKRYRYADERVLHEGLAAALDEAAIAYEREVPMLPVGGRIDFLVGNVGIEVKVKGSAARLAEQVERYARCERVREFLVVTTRPTHRLVEGKTIYGTKSIHVMTIGGLSL